MKEVISDKIIENTEIEPIKKNFPYEQHVITQFNTTDNQQPLKESSQEQQTLTQLNSEKNIQKKILDTQKEENKFINEAVKKINDAAKKKLFDAESASKNRRNILTQRSRV